jgi:hypothetical protein
MGEANCYIFIFCALCVMFDFYDMCVMFDNYFLRIIPDVLILLSISKQSAICEVI